MNPDNVMTFIVIWTIVVLIGLFCILWLLLHYQQGVLITEFTRLGFAFLGGGGAGTILTRLFLNRRGD